MITVEIRDPEKINGGMAEVEVFCDAEGLSLLLKQLQHLKAGSSHIHLMTPAWAGNELGEEVIGKGNLLIHHLRISMIT